MHHLLDMCGNLKVEKDLCSLCFATLDHYKVESTGVIRICVCSVRAQAAQLTIHMENELSLFSGSSILSVFFDSQFFQMIPYCTTSIHSTTNGHEIFRTTLGEKNCRPRIFYRTNKVFKIGDWASLIIPSGWFYDLQRARIAFKIHQSRHSLHSQSREFLAQSSSSSLNMIFYLFSQE